MKTETLKSLSERLAKAADLPDDKRKEEVAKVMDEMSTAAKVEKATTVFAEIATRADALSKALKDGEALTDEQATEMEAIATLAKSAHENAVQKAEADDGSAGAEGAGDQGEGAGDEGTDDKGGEGGEAPVAKDDDQADQGGAQGENGDSGRAPTEKSAKFAWPRDMADKPKE